MSETAREAVARQDATVWTENPGVQLRVQRDGGPVTLTLYDGSWKVEVIIASWRWDRIASAMLAAAPKPPAD